MSLLALLWWTSLVMAAAAVVWMVSLIGGRLLRERGDRRRMADQTRVRFLFLEIMGGDPTAALRLKPYRTRARLMAEMLLEVLGLVRGRERDLLIGAVAEMGVADRLRARLTRGSKAGRIAAAEALAAFPDLETIQALHAALARSRHGDFRVAAMIALIDMEAPPELGALLADISARGLQDSLLYEPVIRRVAAAAPLEALDLFLSPTTSVQARTVLAEALAATGDYRAVESLAEAAWVPDMELRIAAVRALGVLGHPAAESVILAAMTDSSWEVRAAASEAAGRIGLIGAAPALTRALGDPAWWVRFRAGEALAALGDKGIASLRLAARVDQDVVRRAAALALAERGLEAAAA